MTFSTVGKMMASVSSRIRVTSSVSAPSRILAVVWSSCWTALTTDSSWLIIEGSAQIPSTWFVPQSNLIECVRDPNVGGQRTDPISLAREEVRSRIFCIIEARMETLQRGTSESSSVNAKVSLVFERTPAAAVFISSIVIAA